MHRRTVECEIIEYQEENEKGFHVPAVRAICTECGHETESFGTSKSSINRCLVLMSQECPLGGYHWYVVE